MPPALLREVGEALFGPRWQSDLARALNVADRTVRRWDAGSHDVPAGAWDDLRALLTQRRRVLETVRDKLPR